MKIEDFYSAFLKSLNRNKVEFLVIGGYAVKYHGYDRDTMDMDIWYNPNQENVERVMSTIKEFEYDISNLSVMEKD